MKKKLLLLFLPILLLTGCNNSSGGAIPPKEREQIELTLDNYSKYIAVYTISDSYAVDTIYTLYRYRFEGSSLCKFNDCKVEYTFTKKDGTQLDVVYIKDLTISGCGETEEVSAYRTYQLDSYYYHLKVLNVSGTVEVLY